MSETKEHVTTFGIGDEVHIGENVYATYDGRVVILSIEHPGHRSEIRMSGRTVGKFLNFLTAIVGGTPGGTKQSDKTLNVC